VTKRLFERLLAWRQFVELQDSSRSGSKECGIWKGIEPLIKDDVIAPALPHLQFLVRTKKLSSA
jgi:hypothetical protein